METNAGYPSVFVVDRPQKDVSFVPPVRHSQRPRQYGQLLLRILVLLTLAGLVIQAYFLICFRKELDNATVQVLPPINDEGPGEVGGRAWRYTLGFLGVRAWETDSEAMSQLGGSG